MLAQRFAELAYRQTWQLFVAAGAVWVLLACVGKSRPHLKYLLWGAVLAKAVTPPIWASSASLFGGVQTLLDGAEPLATAASETSLALNSPLVAFDASQSPAVDSASRVAGGAADAHWNWTAICGFGWGAGGIALGGVLLARYTRLIRTVERTSIDVPDDLREEVAESSARLGLARPPRVYLTTSAVGPAVTGVVAPKLILPVELWREMSPSDRRMVLTHELLHLARRDPLTAWLQSAIQLAWWFHPAVWLASREFSAARELCCDAELLSRESSGPSDYARCLLRVAIRRAQASLAPIGVVLRSTAGIKSRVAWMTSPAARFRRRTPWSAWAIAALVLLVLLPSQGVRRVFEVAAAEPPGVDRRQADDKAEPSEGAAEPQPQNAELIAVTWQQIADANFDRIEQPAWRPDGTQLDKKEVGRLLDQLQGFQTHWWRKDESVRPLVFVFRAPPKITTGSLTTAIVVGENRRLWPGSATYIVQNGLTKSACSPRREELAAWPNEVDVDVKVPIDNEQVIKRLDKIPDQPVDVAPGVKWYIDPQRGIDFSNGQAPQSGLTAAVLELEHDGPDTLVFYDAKVCLQGEKEPLLGAYSTIIVPRPGVQTTIRVSRPIDDVQKIERVEFTRQRYMFQRIRGVKTRLDLLPPND